MPCKKDVPKILKINKIVSESKNHKSIFFKNKLDCKPGQFIMVWLPGVDEKPMAVSYLSNNEFAFTFQIIGKFTKALSKLKRGDKVGIRGPYGNGFSTKQNACVIGGGCGMASVSTLIDTLKNPVIINGSKNKDNIIYLKRYKKAAITTDDGSLGKKGFPTEVLGKILKKKKIKIVYTCGPEIMMKKIVDICNKHKIECEASLERYMSCGYGICGKCMVNDKLVCIDGPVFNSKQLSKMEDFGKYARLKSGKKVTLKEHHS